MRMRRLPAGGAAGSCSRFFAKDEVAEVAAADGSDEEAEPAAADGSDPAAADGSDEVAELAAAEGRVMGTQPVNAKPRVCRVCR